MKSKDKSQRFIVANGGEPRVVCESPHDAMLVRKTVDLTREGICKALLGEAERYRTLAEKEALRIILSPADVGPAKVREHLTRAETFKAAAAIAGGAL